MVVIITKQNTYVDNFYYFIFFYFFLHNEMLTITITTDIKTDILKRCDMVFLNF